MNIKFNTNKLKEYSAFSEMSFSTPAEADLVILGFIESNKMHPTTIEDFLTNNSPNIPGNKWFDYYIRFIHLNGDSAEAVAKKAIELADEIKSKKISTDIFAKLEHALAGRIQPTFKAELIEKMARQAYAITSDARYRLFADYAYLYSTEDTVQLESAVKELDSLRSESALKEDNRCYFYLLTLALQRLCILNGQTISELQLSEMYNDIMRSNVSTTYGEHYEDDYDYDDYDYDSEESDELTCISIACTLLSDDEDDDIFDVDSDSCNDCYDYNDVIYSNYNIFECIHKYNCPEIANLFKPTSVCFCEANFLRKLNEVVIKEIRANTYRSEKKSVLLQESVFLS